ncbi:MAG TPA: DMT family transporter [Candidatus Corynebacterium avicola]|uniref:DMT family transporter n=1 Tax=Candidatus Corynebacterium avicola TaxID=2838527 RepID=A0A9D1UJR5_9CORY|nr:DMT family transporter [Candidatus Corynebacterium avicola]
MNTATRTLITATVPAIWGTSYYVTTEFLPPGHPWFAALLRALPAGLIALALARQLPRGDWWWKSLVLGALNIGLFFPLLFIAAGELPGGVAATLGASQPVFVAFLAVGLLGERLSGWRLGWTVVSIVGVALVAIRPDAGFSALGILAGVAMAASMATGVVLTKKWGRPDGVSPVALAGWQLTAGGLVLLAPALLIDGVPSGIDAPAVGGYLWLGLIGCLLTYTIWFSNLPHLPITAAALLGILSPLVAALVGVTLGGESLTALQVAGFVLAIIAMAAGQVTPQMLRRQFLTRSTPRKVPA